MTSPLLAAICTVPSTSLTRNSVHCPEAGFTVTSPISAPTDFEVATVIDPCSSLRDSPPNCTSESGWTTMFDPVALMLATASFFVWIRSPEKTADDLGIFDPLTHAEPFAYSMAAPESAANREPGRSTISEQVSNLLKMDIRMATFFSRRILLILDRN